MQASKLFALVAVAWPAMAAAHPGHGAAPDVWSALHYLTEPLHVATAALALLVLGAGLWRLIRSRSPGSGA